MRPALDDSDLEVEAIAVAFMPKSEQVAVASDRSTKALTLSLLADVGDFDVQAAVGGNPSAPVDVLRDLAERDAAGRDIAGNPSTPVETLARLSTVEAAWWRTPGDDEVIVTGPLAANPSTPPDTLSQLLAKSPAGGIVAENVAANPNFPADSLDHLARSQAQGVPTRNVVAGNPRTPAKTLRLLARDKYHGACYRDTCPPAERRPALVIVRSAGTRGGGWSRRTGGDRTRGWWTGPASRVAPAGFEVRERESVHRGR